MIENVEPIKDWNKNVEPIKDCECKNNKATIMAAWQDNGQVMMTIECRPDELATLQKLFEFISEIPELDANYFDPSRIISE